MAKPKASPAPVECKACRAPLGDGPKVAPFFVDQEGQNREPFCPPCFVYVRAPLEPLRFAGGAFTPVHCGSCGWDNVAVGRIACGQCGGPHVIVLPAKESA